MCTSQIAGGLRTLYSSLFTYLEYRMNTFIFACAAIRDKWQVTVPCTSSTTYTSVFAQNNTGI